MQYRKAWFMYTLLTAVTQALVPAHLCFMHVPSLQAVGYLGRLRFFFPNEREMSLHPIYLSLSLGSLCCSSILFPVVQLQLFCLTSLQTFGRRSTIPRDSSATPHRSFHSVTLMHLSHYFGPTIQLHSLSVSFLRPLSCSYGAVLLPYVYHPITYCDYVVLV